MDLTTYDATDHPGLKPGDWLDLIGPGRTTDDVAAADVLVVLPEREGHLVQRQPVLGELGGLGPDLELLRQSAPGVDLGDARHALRRAQVVFDDLGAAGWGDRTRAELAATGAPVTTAAEPAWRVLSPQELQIARLAAEGLSNREIGQRLYLSHRTIGSHLYRIFPKLGISSRAQLGSALAGGSFSSGG